jgi:hypothetical protein
VKASWASRAFESVAMAACAVFACSLISRSNAATSAPSTVTIAPLSGTLFFSDMDRSQLDRARDQVKRGGKTQEIVSNRLSSNMVINGFVKRNDGNTTIWVDDALKTKISAAQSAALYPLMVGSPAFSAVIEKNERSRAMSRDQMSRPSSLRPSDRARPKKRVDDRQKRSIRKR